MLHKAREVWNLGTFASLFHLRGKRSVCENKTWFRILVMGPRSA